jgi:hypothetical protein
MCPGCEAAPLRGRGFDLLMTTISAPLAAPRRSAPAPFLRPGARHPRVAARLPGFRIALGSMAIVTGLVISPATSIRAARTMPARRPAAVLAVPEAGSPPPARLARPTALDTLEFSGLPQESEARRTNAGRREDLLRIGAFERPEAYIHLRTERLSESETDPPPASFSRRRAGPRKRALGVGRSAQPELVATKLGPAEVAPVMLSGASERSCLAFRLHRAESNLRLGGWLCGPRAGRRRRGRPPA